MAAYTIRLLNSQYERHIVVEGSRVTDGIFSPVSLKQEDFKAAVDGLFITIPKRIYSESEHITSASTPLAMSENKSNTA